MKGENLGVLRNIVLNDCKSDFSFWVCNGNIMKNLYDLLGTLKSADEWVFRYHVNDDNKKNDFANWIRDVLGDKILADRLKNVMSKNTYLKIVERRIRQLENA